jgi:hypothetical protein
VKIIKVTDSETAVNISRTSIESELDGAARVWRISHGSQPLKLSRGKDRENKKRAKRGEYLFKDLAGTSSANAGTAA